MKYRLEVRPRPDQDWAFAMLADSPAEAMAGIVVCRNKYPAWQCRATRCDGATIHIEPTRFMVDLNRRHLDNVLDVQAQMAEADVFVMPFAPGQTVDLTNLPVHP